jgi:hypothetical protein
MLSSRYAKKGSWLKIVKSSFHSLVNLPSVQSDVLLFLDRQIVAGVR